MAARRIASHRRRQGAGVALWPLRCLPAPFREERAVRKGEDCFRREGGREPRELKGGPTASGG